MEMGRAGRGGGDRPSDDQIIRGKPYKEILVAKHYQFQHCIINCPCSDDQISGEVRISGKAAQSSRKQSVPHTGGRSQGALLNGF